jgi:hypothetical protein
LATVAKEKVTSVRDAIIATIGSGDEALVAALMRELDAAQLPVDVALAAITEPGA